MLLLKFLYSLLRPQAQNPRPEVVTPETVIYSSIYNETNAQGHLLAKTALDRIKDMLDGAHSHPTESPILRAKRAYSGYQAVEEKYVELLTSLMREWIEAKHGEAIRELKLEVEVAELLPQAIEPAHQRFRTSAESMFHSRAADIRQAELVGIFENKHDPMEFVTMPEWMVTKEQS